MGDGYQLRTEDLKSVDTIGRPLNEALKDVARRLELLERNRNDTVTVEFRTAATVAATFPIKVTPPDGMKPQGAKVARIENPDAPGVALTTAVWAQVRTETDGTLTILYVTGLAVNTRYRMLLEVMGRA